MIQKIRRGGDYHSEVAVEMFPHLREVLDRGEVTLNESDPCAALGTPTIKERFSAERGNAKAINFGIIYGKTPVSLAEDLNIKVKDAEALMDTWYKDKPLVKQWLLSVEQEAKHNRRVRSLLGRWRDLPFADTSLPPPLFRRSL